MREAGDHAATGKVSQPAGAEVNPRPSAPASDRRLAPPLVVRFGAFGDMIMLVPLARALAWRYGQKADVISSAPWTRPLLQQVEAVGSIRLLSSRRTPFVFNLSQWRLVIWLRLRPAGPVYVCEHDAKTYRLLRLGGIRDEWICRLPQIPREPGEHVVEQFLRFARLTPPALGGVALNHGPQPLPDHHLISEGKAQQDCAAWLAKGGLTGGELVLIQPGNKKTMRRGDPGRASNIKYWPAENWAAVIRGVRSSLPKSQVLVCGTKQESELVADIIGRCGGDGRVRNVAGELPIPRLLALQTRAHSMISVDTGPSHAATAVGCPVVVLIIDDMLAACGPRATTAATAVVVAPHAKTAGISSPLEAISPGEVLAAWQGLTAKAS